MTTIAPAVALLILQGAPVPAEPGTEKTVTIVGIGERPGWGSGVTKTSVLILGRDDEGAIRPYFLTYFGEDQALPGLGSRRTFVPHRGRLEIVGGIETVPLLAGDDIGAFECGPAPSDEELLQSEWLRQPD